MCAVCTVNIGDTLIILTQRIIVYKSLLILLVIKVSSFMQNTDYIIWLRICLPVNLQSEACTTIIIRQ